MDDVLLCPICNNKLKTQNFDDKYFHIVGKSADYTKRVCSSYYHVLVIWADKKTKKIDYLKTSLNAKYSKFIEINFINQTSKISYFKDSQYSYIEVPLILELDFPYLTDLKDKANMYLLFS